MGVMSVPAIELFLTFGGMAICPPGSGAYTRVRTMYQFAWIVEGQATWTCNGALHQAPPGTLLLARPGMEDSFRWDPERPTRVVYLGFKIRQGLERLPPPEEWPLVLQLQDDDLLQPLLRQIMKLSEQRPPDWQHVAHGAAVHLLESFVTRTYDTWWDEEWIFPEAVERALAYVLQRWEAERRSSAITLEDLSRAASVSPRQLSRLFRLTFGSGPVQALRLARLEMAADFLRHTDLTLTRIAETTGFANAFHLSHAFKAVNGVSPAAFRLHPASPSGASAQGRRLLGKLLPRQLPSS